MNYIKILDKHAPIKYRIVRGNNANFMKKELQKAIMKRSRLRNKFNFSKNNKNWKEFRTQRNLRTTIKCIALRYHTLKGSAKILVQMNFGRQSKLLSRIEGIVGHSICYEDLLKDDKKYLVYSMTTLST